MDLKKLFKKFDLQSRGYLTRREYTALAYYIGKEPILRKEKIFFDDLKFRDIDLSDDIYEFLGGSEMSEETIRDALKQLNIENIDGRKFYDYLEKIRK